jgi:hypothetical protein
MVDVLSEATLRSHCGLLPMQHCYVYALKGSNAAGSQCGDSRLLCVELVLVALDSSSHGSVALMVGLLWRSSAVSMCDSCATVA